MVAAATCAEHFHARRDAVSRTYRYVVLCRDSRAPVARQYAWTVRGPLDVDGMRAAASALAGTHDFASFGAATAPGGTTVRTVDAAAVDHVVLGMPADRPDVEAVVLTVRANAFLRGMESVGSPSCWAASVPRRVCTLRSKRQKKPTFRS